MDVSFRECPDGIHGAPALARAAEVAPSTVLASEGGCLPARRIHRSSRSARMRAVREPAMTRYRRALRFARAELPQPGAVGTQIGRRRLKENELSDLAGRVPQFERDGSTLRFGHGGSRVTMSVCTPRIVRVELGGDGQAIASSYVGSRQWPGGPFDLSGRDVSRDEPLRLTTADLGIEITADPLRLAFLDSTGAWLLREPVDGGMSSETVGDGSSRRRVRACFTFSGEQHFYGLGQGGRGFDRLGLSRQLWNSHLGHGPGSDMGVPLLVSNRGYALFFDDPSEAVLTVGRSEHGVRIVHTAETGRLVWYFLIGRDLRGLMGEVAELLGRAPLPPRWALGYLQSTRHFDDTAEVSRLPRTIREKRIPCDGLIYLSTYGEALGWNRGVGHLEWQPELWPDPRAAVDEARRR